jgi:inorganic phosphate transporter, PiT family
MLTVLLIMILLALVFEFINGFHDTANSIATIVGTKVLTPRAAIMLAAICDLTGALMGTSVAKTITSGVVNSQVVGNSFIQYLVICALVGGIVWNLITWFFGIPSSSTHALVGGMVGATIGITNGNWDGLIWSRMKPDGHMEGIYHKVVLPMITSPVCGFVIGFMVMGLLMAVISKIGARPSKVNSIFGKLQIVSSAAMGVMHGFNDAQKVMGIITLGLVAGTTSGAFQGLPDWMSFVVTPEVKGGNNPAAWVKILCATVMACGTAMGGWRIIRTLGHKMVKLQPVHGFAAETTAATVLGVAAYFGMPVSTTHSITTSIMGVGCTKRFSALKFSLVEKILWAWVLTIPSAALVAYGLARLGKFTGIIP